MKRIDMLEEIFRLQCALNSQIGVDTVRMSRKEREKWVLNYCRAMSQELAELTNCLPWKWWVKSRGFDKQNARVEVVDLLHFLISLAQVLEISPKDLYEAYRKKHAVNIRRQNLGYTEKDETDNKGI